MVCQFSLRPNSFSSLSPKTQSCIVRCKNGNDQNVVALFLSFNWLLVWISEKRRLTLLFFVIFFPSSFSRCCMAAYSINLSWNCKILHRSLLFSQLKCSSGMTGYFWWRHLIKERNNYFKLFEFRKDNSEVPACFNSLGVFHWFMGCQRMPIFVLTRWNFKQEDHFLKGNKRGHLDCLRLLWTEELAFRKKKQEICTQDRFSDRLTVPCKAFLCSKTSKSRWLFSGSGCMLEGLLIFSSHSIWKVDISACDVPPWVTDLRTFLSRLSLFLG